MIKASFFLNFILEIDDLERSKKVKSKKVRD